MWACTHKCMCVHTSVSISLHYVTRACKCSIYAGHAWPYACLHGYVWPTVWVSACLSMYTVYVRSNVRLTNACKHSLSTILGIALRIMLTHYDLVGIEPRAQMLERTVKIRYMPYCFMHSATVCCISRQYGKQCNCTTKMPLHGSP
jgi:hypothetical protein